MNQTLSLDGRIALVVGAGGGIGEATARALAAEGATVALADIAVDRLKEIAGDLPPGSHSTHAVDLSDPVGPAALIRDVVVKHESLHIVIGAAGFLRTAPLLDLDVADWDLTLAINVRGNVLLAQAAAREFIERRISGRIVVVASISSRVARLNNVAYAASKAALVQAVRSMALELAPHQITVNAVSPGSTGTRMLLETQLHGSPDALHDAIYGDLATWRLGVPLGRLADPADQAAAAVFLASDAARHITGHELIVDGGQSLV
jgi:2,3-dihydro-2,3-dihydroxybenzoate dehydrogenase